MHMQLSVVNSSKLITANSLYCTWNNINPIHNSVAKCRLFMYCLTKQVLIFLGIKMEIFFNHYVHGLRAGFYYTAYGEKFSEEFVFLK